MVWRKWCTAKQRDNGCRTRMSAPPTEVKEWVKMGLFSKNSNAPKPVESQIPTSVIATPPDGIRAQENSLPPAASASAAHMQLSERQIYLEKMKVRIHQQLVERLDVQNLKNVPQEAVRAEVRQVIRDLCQLEKGLLTSSEQERLMDEVMDETFGLGPLEAMFKDGSITDILINRYDRVYVERRGRLEPVDVHFRDDNHLRQIIDRIVAQVGRRIDEICPMVDARLPDGSRINAIIPPLAVDGSAMSIRRFGASPLQLEDLLRHVAFHAAMIDFLAAAVRSRCKILISGGTGAGETTLLNRLVRHNPLDQRTIIIRH